MLKVNYMQVTTADYEVKSIEPMKIIAKTEDENIVIRVFFIPISIYITDDQKSISPVVNAVVSVKTDKPRFGEPCTSSKVMLTRRFPDHVISTYFSILLDPWSGLALGVVSSASTTPHGARSRLTP